MDDEVLFLLILNGVIPGFQTVISLEYEHLSESRLVRPIEPYEPYKRHRVESLLARSMSILDITVAVSAEEVTLIVWPE